MLPLRRVSFYSTRLKTFDYLGEHRYTLTLCTVDRRPDLVDAETTREALTQLTRAAASTGFAVPVYCFMPDHLHLLAIGTGPDSDLRRFIRLLKQLTEYAHRRRTGRPLWQRSIWERVLRSNEETLALARYILENPIRAGLAESATDWPGSGSLVYEREELLAIAFRDRSPRVTR